MSKIDAVEAHDKTSDEVVLNTSKRTKVKKKVALKEDNKRSNPPNETRTRKKYPFSEWAKKSLTGKNDVFDVEQIIDEEKHVGIEFSALLSSQEYVPTNQVKWNSLPIATLLGFIRKTKNPRALIEIYITSYFPSISKNLLSKYLALDQQGTLIVEALSKNSKSAINESLLLGIINNVPSSMDEASILPWWIISNMADSDWVFVEKSPMWNFFTGRIDTLFSIESNLRNKILKKIQTQLDGGLKILDHFEIEKASKKQLDELEKYLKNIAIDHIYFYAKYHQSLRTRNLIEKVFLFRLRNELSASMTLETCLPHLALEAIFPGIYGGDHIQRIWNRVQKSEKGLIEFFRSNEIATLKAEKEVLEEKILEQKIYSESLLKTSENQVEIISNLRSTLDSYEKRLQVEMTESSKGRLASDNQVKIDVIKSLVLLLHPELISGEHHKIQIALAKFGINQIGTMGRQTNWNPLECESLTGSSLLDPVVVEPGYKWNFNGEVVVLKKALVKPFRGD